MKHIPQRMCVACRKMYPQNELIRLVRDNKTGEIKFDCDKKLFGRGAYICKNIDCIRNAEKKFYKTKFVEAGSKAELGKFTGADSRAVVSVNDDNFAKAILDRLND